MYGPDLSINAYSMTVITTARQCIDTPMAKLQVIV